MSEADLFFKKEGTYVADILVLQDTNLNSINLDKEKYNVFLLNDTVKPCVGCFGCWIKTPGKCVIKDKYSDFATILPHVREVIIVSKLVFGGLSPNVKAIFDRSIGFILPFFRDVDGEMHHQQRYRDRPAFKYMFYGSKISLSEKNTAKKLIKANAINLGTDKYSINFYNSAFDALEELK